MNEHGCHDCGEERAPRVVAGRRTCPECGSENIVSLGPAISGNDIAAEIERLESQEVTAVPWDGPQTVEEARCFHEGFLAGATAYAREECRATTKADNPILRTLFEEQGWKTIELYESLAKERAQ